MKLFLPEYWQKMAAGLATAAEIVLSADEALAITRVVGEAVTGGGVEMRFSMLDNVVQRLLQIS